MGISSGKSCIGIDDLWQNMVDVDLVAIVLTPTPNHYQSIIKLLECNLNVICEKPLSISRKEEKIKEIASKERIISV